MMWYKFVDNWKKFWKLFPYDRRTKWWNQQWNEKEEYIYVPKKES